MRIFIENYKGFDIIFTTEAERFSFSVDDGSQTEKQSYSACKRNIDEFLKKNKPFKPFKARSFYDNKIINIIGITKDKRFVYKYLNDTKRRIPEYEEKDYVIYDENDDVIYEETQKIELEIQRLLQLRDAKHREIISPTLRAIKPKYINTI